MNIRQLIEALKWLARLPLTFSISFVALAGSWLLLGYGVVAKMSLYKEMEGFLRTFLVSENLYGIEAVGVMVNSVINILVILAGLFLAYNAAVALNQGAFWLWARFSRPKKMTDYAPSNPVLQKGKSRRKIGIILAGGGAKGSFQAGAMRAIHEYLEAKNALGDVCMIAGTSIGSWNALFWLADLVKADASGQSFHQRWWSLINARSVINPAYYVPFMANSFFSTAPWEVQFDRIFLNNKNVRERILASKIRFYLTRTNVGSGKLEFVTNNPGSDRGISMTPFNTKTPDDYLQRRYIEKNLYKVASQANVSAYLQTLKEGVFASMDLPPMFPYKHIDKEYFEDGGVIDNLPVRFGVEVEDCDLLFVIPLNSDFEEDVNTNSIISRLYRVMNIRQGALERHALHLVDLFNATVEVRGAHLDSLLYESSGSVGGGKGKTRKGRGAKKEDFYYYDDPWFSDWEGDAVERFFKQQSRDFKRPTRVFAVCPRRPLVIDTVEFWKTKEAAEAFTLMYEATRDILAEKDPLSEDYSYSAENVVLHLVSRNKDVTEDRNI